GSRRALRARSQRTGAPHERSRAGHGHHGLGGREPAPPGDVEEDQGASRVEVGARGGLLVARPRRAHGRGEPAGRRHRASETELHAEAAGAAARADGVTARARPANAARWPLRRVLALVAILSALQRGLYVLEVHDRPFWRVPLVDAADYHAKAM